MHIPSEQIAPKAFAEGKTILVVEDDELVRELAVGQLESAGFRVAEAQTGEDAVRRFEVEAPDFLLTDIALPGRMDGWDVAERCRTVEPEVPVVYFTAHSFVRGRPVPGSRYVKKPYLAFQLLSAFKDLAPDTRAPSSLA